MNITEALDNIQNLLVGEYSIPVDINNKAIGLNEQKVVLLMNTLEFIATYYEQASSIPKSLAFAFVDVSSAFERAYPLYSEEEQEVLFDFKEDIVSKAYEIFE